MSLTTSICNQSSGSSGYTVSGGVYRVEHVGSGPIEGVTVELLDDTFAVIDTTVTGANGLFSFNVVDPALTLYLEATKSETFATGAELADFGVSSAQATRIQQYVTDPATYPLPTYQLTSADSNDSTTITSFDGSIITFGLSGNATALGYYNTKAWFMIDSASTVWLPPEERITVTWNGADYNTHNFMGVKKSADIIV